MSNNDQSDNQQNGNHTAAQATAGAAQRPNHLSPAHKMSIVRDTLRRLNAECNHPEQTRKVKFVFDFKLDGEADGSDHMFDLCTEISATDFLNAVMRALAEDAAKHQITPNLSGMVLKSTNGQ